MEYAVRAETKEGDVVTLKRGFPSLSDAEDYPVRLCRWRRVVWYHKDEAFALKWDDAVATGIDLLESTCFKRAMAGNDAMATLLLKGRRAEVFNPHVAVPSNMAAADHGKVFQLMTVPEAIEQVKQLGLPTPVLEGDYVTIDENNSTTASARGRDKT